MMEQTTTSAPRYREFGPWLLQAVGEKVQKISVNAGFTCPNRDGRVGTGGCTYCNNQTFNPAYCDTGKSVAQQLEEGKVFFRRKYPRMQFLAYFQAYTNTYGGLEELRRKYEEALSVEGVVGLVIGTRPDCVWPELLDYLADLRRRCFVLVEYGIESTDDDVLRRINRGHDFAAVEQAVRATAARGIPVGGHLILGLPGGGRMEERVAQDARRLSALPLTTLKLHQLQLIRGTRMAEEYAARPGDFRLFSADEYVDLVVDFVERVRPDLVFERFVSQSPASLLAVEGWGLKNYEFVERVRRRMEQRDTWQGRLYAP
jgi:radical SAM protein (TIGR01212 family)